MNPGGKTAGGGKGGGRRKCGGGDEVLKKSFALQTTRAHMLTLRQALTTDAGKDRNVTEAFKPFMTFARNGLDLELQFATGAKLERAQSRCAKKLVEAHAAALEACGLSVEDKVADYKDPAARFLFVRRRAADADSEPELLGFAHFRFTLQGELLQEMEGLPVLLIADLFLSPLIQRRGVGSHILNLCQLMAKSCGMAGVMVAAYTALTPAAGPFLLQKLKGFALDATWTPDADAGIVAYSKMFGAAAPSTPAPALAPAAAAESPDSVLAAHAAGASPASPAPAAKACEAAVGIALASQFESVSVQDAPAAAAKEVPFWERITLPPAAAEAAAEGLAASDESESEDASDNSGDEDADGMSDRLLSELCVMFEERNGRPPTDEEIEIWKAQLSEASEEAAQ